MYKRRIVRALVDWLGDWNKEVHEAVEAKVISEYKRMFPEGAKDPTETLGKMRAFYYNGISTTANLVIAGLALLVAIASLLVSAVV